MHRSSTTTTTIEAPFSIRTNSYEFRDDPNHYVIISKGNDSGSKDNSSMSCTPQDVYSYLAFATTKTDLRSLLLLLMISLHYHKLLPRYDSYSYANKLIWNGRYYGHYLYMFVFKAFNGSHRESRVSIHIRLFFP